MTVPAELRDRACTWISGDPDPRTRHELMALIERAEREEPSLRELTDRFAGRLDFGTAGLRGELAAGPNRMNRAVVIQTAAALASYLLDARGGGTVVIGYDARHDSDLFATDSAAVFAAAGLDAVVLPGPLPTPVLAFAVRHLRCVAGVMVTASHNPPRDNGYKVYLGDGCQIVPPVDGDIAERIAAVPPAACVARADNWRVLSLDVVDNYVTAVAALTPPRSNRGLRIAYTPLHGVGGELVRRVLDSAGFEPPLVVPEQAAPDPDFPTVPFPNPEEPGALDRALELAHTGDADLVLANDPDADRCAAAVPTGGTWRVLSGDEIGVLLADACLRRGVSGVYATTIVSSSMLRLMAADYGMRYAETLTGFKWLGRVPDLAFAYEEALGYCVAPSLVRDKDGISASLLLANTAATLRADGQSLLDRLALLERRYGVHRTDQVSSRLESPRAARTLMRALRAQQPRCFGDVAVERVDDLFSDSAELPPTDALRFWLGDGARVVVRPSGTEPKIKAYLEVVEPISGGSLDAAHTRASHRLGELREEVTRTLQPERAG